MAVGRSLGPASLCPGRSRALGRGRGGGDETSEMADHQPYSLCVQRGGGRLEVCVCVCVCVCIQRGRNKLDHSLFFKTWTTL